MIKSKRLCVVTLAGVFSAFNLFAQEPTFRQKFEREQGPSIRLDSDHFATPRAASAKIAAEERLEDTFQAQQARIEHLRIAAENLSRAHFEAESRQLTQRADAMEAEFHRGRNATLSPRILVELHALRASVEALREEVAALRRQLGETEPTPAVAPTRGEKQNSGIPTRGAAISNAELDQPHDRHAFFDKLAPKAADQPAAAVSEIEFELVPVETKDEPAAPEAAPKDEPVPTPIVPEQP